MIVQDTTKQLGVHSVDHFAIEVPDLNEARSFYSTFGLDVRDEGGGLGLYTKSHRHRWGVVTKGGGTKKLRYLSFGVYESDFAPFEKQLAAQRVKMIKPPAGTDGKGLWFEGFDGLPINLRIAEKSSPDEKSKFFVPSVGPGECGAFATSKAPRIFPRRLSHVLIFTTDVLGAIAFYEKTLGLKLSDRSMDAVAFLHGAHGSDHHMLALAKSDHRGLHHTSWDVGSVQDIGLGAAQMARAGHTRGWGLGRHVLGSNYFHYIRDPWGSYSEYSADIDYIPAGMNWPAADHPPEDALYLWGPPPPEDFIVNFEPAG